MNGGTQRTYPGLGLYSSFDGGRNWHLILQFANTDKKSTADGELQGNTLSIVFMDKAGSIRFSQLEYDSGQRTWLLITSENAFAASDTEAINPTLAIDATGAWWCAFVGRDLVTGNYNIRLIRRDALAAEWSDTGQVFGPTDSESKERSARLLRIPNGVGMVLRIREFTYWATRLDGAPADSPWTVTTVYQGTIPQRSSSDTWASHFGVIADDAYNLHLVLVDDRSVFYFRLLNGAPAWSTGRKMHGRRNPGYVQIGIANGQIVVAISSSRDAGELFTSSDTGATFLRAHELLVPTATPEVSYKTARIEMPSRSTGRLAVLQQYEDSRLQRLMLYDVSAP